MPLGKTLTGNDNINPWGNVRWNALSEMHQQGHGFDVTYKSSPSTPIHYWGMLEFSNDTIWAYPQSSGKYHTIINWDDVSRIDYVDT
jgi:hypothetical protein